MNTASLTQLLQNFLDDFEVQDFKLMTQGKENTTALVRLADRPVIVRIWGETHGYMGEHSDADVADEVAFMEFCREKNVPVPQLFRSKNNRLYEKTPEGLSYTVMEFIEGESPTNFAADEVTQIAQTMARMNLLVSDFAFPQPRSWPGTVLDMTNDRIAKFEAGEFALNQQDAMLIAEAVSYYRELLAGCNLSALPKGVIHGDIMWENMKFKDGRLEAIFDFGDCRESYFVEDITKTLLFEFESSEHCVFGEDGKNVQVFLDAYQKVRPLSEAEKQSLPLFYVSRFLYQLLGYCAKAAKGKTEYQTRIDTVIARYKQHQTFFK